MIIERAGVKFTLVPFEGNPENMQVLLGGHIMARAMPPTGGRTSIRASCGCWPYGSKPTKRWPTVPTLAELGYDSASDSPFGVCDPKGMDPAVVRTPHDAFKKTLDDPAVLSTFDKYDQTAIYMNTEDYTKFAQKNFVAEKATIERLGLASKT